MIHKKIVFLPSYNRPAILTAKEPDGRLIRVLLLDIRRLAMVVEAVGLRQWLGACEGKRRGAAVLLGFGEVSAS